MEIRVAVKKEFTEQVAAMAATTKAERIDAARQILVDAGMLSDKEDEKVQVRMAKAFYTPVGMVRGNGAATE